MLNDKQTAESKEIAENILVYMGSNKFRAMTGAKNFTVIHRGLRFNLPGYKTNTVVITQGTDSLFHMMFMKVGKSVSTSKILAEYNEVFADQLQMRFTLATGLDTHL